MPGENSLRETLRSLPVFAGDLSPFDPADASADPTALFRVWLLEAIQAGVVEPHAMTLATCDSTGLPDARVLILKDLDADGFWFASSSDSAKGRQLAAHPAAALTFYWSSIGRQVRVRGAVERASSERSAADFLARGASARAVVVASADDTPLLSRADCSAAVRRALDRLEQTPGLVSPTWALYVVRPEQVEFWQADRERLHTRLLYQRDGDAWTTNLQWP